MEDDKAVELAEIEHPSKTLRPEFDKGSDAPDKIVVICGSAGALQCFLNFANQLPSVSSTAYIYMSHINQSGPTYLRDLLSLKLTLPIHQVDRSMPLQSGHLYIPSQGTDLIVDGNFVRSVDHDPSYYFTPSFSRCIETAVDSFKDQILVSILSGRLDDGVPALQKVFEAGGVTLVQDPEEAPYNSMPVEALRRDHPDCIRSSKDIGKEIAKFSEVTEAQRMPGE
jgi:chemotaxis response regulator CheB